METEGNKNLGNGCHKSSNGIVIHSNEQDQTIPTFQLENYEEPPGTERHHLIKLEDLEGYVNSMCEAGSFKEQYQILKNGQLKPWDVGNKSENKSKNRYSDLLPYDENRVVLEKLKNDAHSDYINASYVNSYNRKKAYICTQGPLENTLGDFWRMIWQEDVKVIAMTANIVENGKKKCEKYWPDKSSKYADVTVTLEKEEVFLEYIIRTFKLQKAGRSGYHSVRQYHYSAWPDHGVPEYPLSLVYMLQDIESFQGKQQKFSPIVLHCSAGVGRSGTVMVLASALQMAEAEKKVDILGLLYTMRQQRINLIETVEQYTFVHRALVDYYFGDVPRRPAEQLVIYFNKLRQVNSKSKQTGLQQQYEVLESFKPPQFQEKCMAAATATNKQKNRRSDILPPDDGRPILKTNPPLNYVNAVYVHDYAKANQFVVTQFPLPGTVTDFWQLLYDLSTSTVVVLNELPKNDEMLPQFWPTSGSMFYGNFKVENVAFDAEYFNGVLTRKLKVKNTSQTMSSRTIKMFELYGWRKDEYVPPQSNFIIYLLNKVNIHNRKHGHGPIVVTCYDGCIASGFYCAASYIAGQIKCCETVDVFQAVRTARLNRPAFIPTVEQYRWLYELSCCLVTNKNVLK